jgi:DNA adenine methylase
MEKEKEVQKAQSIKTPITYYGGKQKLVSKILPLIPPHKLYAEPFVGGAAVFFGKPQSEMEVINDTNTELVNFYKVLQNNYAELESMVKVTLHSRRLHKDAQVVYDNPHLFTEIKRAWAVWVLSTQSFCAMLDGTFGYDKSKNTTTKKITNKRNEFSEEYAIRLQNVQIECADALYVINSRDTIDTFFYCDPPYFNSNCGHYDGYSEQDYENLLIKLSNTKGKFLLSSYPSDILKKYIKANGWHYKCFESGVSVNARGGYLKRKWEMLTANYPI